MPFLIIEAKYGNGGTSLEGKYGVSSLEDATVALELDLRRTADRLFAVEAMEEWNRHPGFCQMPDRNVVWIFTYRETL